MMLLPTVCNTVVGFNNANFHISLTADTVPVTTAKNQNIADTIILPSSDSTALKVDTFNFKIAKGALDVPVEYHADDSMVMSVPDKNIILYGKKSTVDYDNNNLEAPHIEYNQATNLVKAHLVKDSTGKVISYANFKQGDMTTKSDSILFNMKTGRGLTKGTYTVQGEMFVYAETIKRVDESVFYAKRGRFTTCNLDTPHFAFVSEKIKFINKKMAFTGPVHPEFEGVPVPIVLPFGIYPLTQGRHSGLLAPSFTANDQMGLALEGLGYYKILSDNWDVIARGTLYSYGGWTASLAPRYMKRYRYQGNIGLDIQRFKTNFKGDPDFTSSQTFNVRWSHNMDTKARPGVTFTANVNAGSTKFNEQVPNNPRLNFNNQLYSSISYAKVWKDRPYNIAISANHNQNSVSRLINVNLPDLVFNVNTLYPFRKKEQVGTPKWYENLGVALNTNAKSLTSFYDSDTLGTIPNQIRNNLQWGASHNIPITLSLPQLGPLQISPSVSYSERWYQQKSRYSWNGLLNKFDTTVSKGFYTAREMSFGLGASTRIFGMFAFNKGRVKAIRHEIRPFVSISYRPDMNGRYFYTTQVDASGRTARFSEFDRSIYSPYSEGRFGGMSFGIDNNISMKVKDKKDTSAAAMKKVNLIDGLSIASSYNFLRDSFKLDPISMSARSNLFEKINITASALFDPYQTDSIGDRVDKLIWKNKPLSFGRMLSAQVSMQASFRGGDNDGKKNPQEQQLMDPNMYNNTGMPLDEYQQELAYISNNPGEFVDFSIPWDISLGYSFRFNKERNANLIGYANKISQDVNWNSSVNLSPKWKIGINGFYNITENELGTISMFLSREMHCWQMAINISPVGRFKFFNLTISPKSSLLRDVKVNRTRYFVDQ
ncbi:MAG: LPS-assembly protein LptD [Chitinophagaceae bacterium]|nr:MAG: LPS-assembly protein LptD [Chitinophagaceae bacterium]